MLTPVGSRLTGQPVPLLSGSRVPYRPAPRFGLVESAPLVVLYLGSNLIIGPTVLYFMLRWKQTKANATAFVHGHLKAQSDAVKWEFLSGLQNHRDYDKTPLMRAWVLNQACDLKISARQFLPLLLAGLRDAHIEVNAQALDALEKLQKRQDLDSVLKQALLDLATYYPAEVRENMRSLKIKAHVVSTIPKRLLPKKYRDVTLSKTFPAKYVAAEAIAKRYLVN